MVKSKNGPKHQLTEKQRAFCEYYLIDFNGVAACKKAGFSAKSAGTQAVRLLSNPHVKKHLQKLINARSKRTGITQDRVLEEIARIAFSDVRNVLDENGEVKSPKTWDDETAAAIASYDIHKSEDNPIKTSRVRAWDKVAALEKLCKHLGMYEDKEKDLNLNIIINSADADI